METYADTRWLPIATELDQLRYPPITITDGCAGSSVDVQVGGEYQPAFIVKFIDAPVVAGYAEHDYWSNAKTLLRPSTLLSRIITSRLLRNFDWLGFEKDELSHYVLCGGDMVCEAIARDVHVRPGMGT